MGWSANNNIFFYFLIEIVMELLKDQTAWLGALFVTVLAIWLKGFFNQFLPAPQR